MIEEFNKGIYDIIIVSDERSEVFGDEKEEEMKEEGEGEEKKGKKKGGRKGKRDEEYGVLRGIDFKNVVVVVNFDLFMFVLLYIYRIGRMVRVGRMGIVMLFVVLKELFGKYKLMLIKSCEKDEKVLVKIVRV